MNPMRIESQLELTMNSKLQKSEKDNPPIRTPRNSAKETTFDWKNTKKKNSICKSRGCFQKKPCQFPLLPPKQTNKKTNKQVIKSNTMTWVYPTPKNAIFTTRIVKTFLGSGIPTSTLALATRLLGPVKGTLKR